MKWRSGQRKRILLTKGIGEAANAKNNGKLKKSKMA
jgi:hypothetical protein